MTNFATFIDAANEAAPIARRGHAKQKRNDLRLVGLGLVVTRDGAIPVASHTYPGNRPDVTQFAGVLDELTARYGALFARHDPDNSPRTGPHPRGPSMSGPRPCPAAKPAARSRRPGFGCRRRSARGTSRG